MTTLIAFVLIASIVGALMLAQPRGQHRGRHPQTDGGAGFPRDAEATEQPAPSSLCPVTGLDDCPFCAAIAEHSPQVPPDVMDRINAATFPDRSGWDQQ